MLGLTLTQPWASLVAIGAKRIETRSWSTGYRGRIAIHAAKKWSAEDRLLCFDEWFYEALGPAGLAMRNGEPGLEAFLRSGAVTVREAARMPSILGGLDLPVGAIVATGLLVTCEPTQVASAKRGRWEWVFNERERAFGNFEPGRWAFFVDEVRRLETPIPCRGSLGLWDLGDELERELAEAALEAVVR